MVERDWPLDSLDVSGYEVNGDDLKQQAESKVEAKVQEVTRHVGCSRYESHKTLKLCSTIVTART